MQEFTLVDNYLCLNNKKCYSIYNKQNSGPNYDKHTLFKNKDQNKDQNGEEINVNSNLLLKVSKNNKYCAVYSNNNYYCDFYEQFTYINKKNVNDELIEEGIQSIKYLFTLKRKTYRSGDFIMEFIEHPETKETLFIFFDEDANYHENIYCGYLTIYNMKREKVKLITCPEFLYNIELLNEKYFILRGWVWYPVDVLALYNINKMITNDDYHQTHLANDDGDGNFIFCQTDSFIDDDGCELCKKFRIELLKDEEKILIDNVKYDYEYLENHKEELEKELTKKNPKDYDIEDLEYI